MELIARATGALQKLVRRKQGNADDEIKVKGSTQLAKELRIPQLLGIGIGTTIGAGIFILVGTVAKERSGPSVPLSFLVAAIAAALSALGYAELASRFPYAGSAYHYAYTCLGEGFAWLVGWSLLLEYTVGGATVARGISPYLGIFINLPAWLSRRNVFGTDVIADPLAGCFIAIITLILCMGIKQSSAAQTIMTSGLVLVLSFVVIVGTWIGCTTNWPGYNLSEAGGYFPFGVNGMLGGAAALFFSYVGFDALASTAEEVKNPERDLPIGIGLALLICAALYMSVSAVIVGIVPYDKMNLDTPVSDAFARNGMPWAMYIVAAGALAAMVTTLLGCFIPQPRILLSMSRDGLLPPFFAVINKRTAIPVNSAITVGVFAGLLATFMNVEQLSGMVSVGTLVAFTAVGLCVLVIRYISPNSHLPSSSSSSSSSSLSTSTATSSTADATTEKETLLEYKPAKNCAMFGISSSLVGSLCVSLALSLTATNYRGEWVMGIIGGLLVVSGMVVLMRMKKEKSTVEWEGFECPMVPILPILSILINVYLLVNVGAATWMRVSVWILLGVLVYIFYGIRNSVH